MKDRFSGYHNLDWQLFSFKIWNISFHILLACKVSVEKSAIILMVMWGFSVVAFKILSLLAEPNDLIVK
jgi:hypothetical protein